MIMYYPLHLASRHSINWIKDTVPSVPSVPSGPSVPIGFEMKRAVNWDENVVDEHPNACGRDHYLDTFSTSSLKNGECSQFSARNLRRDTVFSKHALARPSSQDSLVLITSGLDKTFGYWPNGKQCLKCQKCTIFQRSCKVAQFIIYY
jgi:hypothetical protein